MSGTPLINCIALPGAGDLWLETIYVGARRLSTGAVGQRLMLGVSQVAPVRMSISFRKQLPWEPTAKV